MAPDQPGKSTKLPPSFQQAAAESSKVMVSLPLDADLAAFFQSESEPGNWQRHINDVLRFYVETSQMAEADAELAVEMAQHHEGPKP